MPTTRLAPSPTGALHLGNARTFLITWAIARQNNWRIILRMEDLDGPRIKTGADQQAITDLTWLGINWDTPQPPEPAIRYQRADLTRYIQAMQSLDAQKRIYPCACTRKEIQSAQSAPHATDHELRYPGTCRCRLGSIPFDYSDVPAPALPGDRVAGELRDGATQNRHMPLESPSADPLPPGHPATRQPDNPGTQTSTTSAANLNWRITLPDRDIPIHDAFAGHHTFNIQRSVGDMVLWTKANLPSYQLAVVVDDFDQGVTDVIRGDDLLDSAARQTLLYEALGLNPIPRWHHLPLVLGPDGKRLAKRHGDTRVAWYRDQGVPPEKIIGLIAFWSGAQSTPAPMSALNFLRAFDISTLPHAPATFTLEDHQWLLSQ